MLRKYAYFIFIFTLFAAVILGHFFRNVWLMESVYWSVWGLCALSLLLFAVLSLNQFKNWLKKRQAKFGIGMTTSALSILAILVALNWFVVQKNKKWDLTRSSIHSLSEQTVNVLEGLKEEVSIQVWTTNVNAMSGKRDMARFFENYSLAGADKLQLQVVNPINDPQGAELAKITRDNVIVVKSSSGREVRIDNYNDTKAEEQITNAIIRAIKGQQKTMCFIVGHGELSINKTDASGLSFVKEALEKSSYKAEEVTLLAKAKVPEQCEAIVVAGPETEPAEAEIQMIQDYLASGGKLLALYGVGVPSAWHKLIEDFGVKVENNIVVDPRVQRPPLSVLTQNYSQEVDIVKSFSNPVFFTFANSLKVPTQASKEGVKVKTFISSENGSYAKSGNLKTIGRDYSRGSSDLTGPLPIAVLISKEITAAQADSKELKDEPLEGKKKLNPPKKEGAFNQLRNDFHKFLDRISFVSMVHAEGPGGASELEAQNKEADSSSDKKEDKKEMNVVLFGNHLFAANGLVTQMGNMDLFLNSANYLFKDSDLIGIRPKDIGSVTLELSSENIYQVRGYIILAALSFIFLGVSVVRRRRASV